MARWKTYFLMEFHLENQKTISAFSRSLCVCIELVFALQKSTNVALKFQTHSPPNAGLSPLGLKEDSSSLQGKEQSLHCRFYSPTITCLRGIVESLLAGLQIYVSWNFVWQCNTMACNFSLQFEHNWKFGSALHLQMSLAKNMEVPTSSFLMEITANCSW